MNPPVCPICSSAVPPSLGSRVRVYCTSRCRIVAQRRRARGWDRRSCGTCGVLLPEGWGVRRYCGRSCRVLAASVRAHSAQARAKRAEYTRAHRTEKQAYDRAYRDVNRLRLQAAEKAYRESDRGRATSAAYRERNRFRRAEWKRRWHYRNRQAQLSYFRAYGVLHPGASSERRMRCERRRNAVVALIQELESRTGGNAE